MRALTFIIFLIFVTTVSSVYPGEINNTNAGGNSQSNNNDEVFPYGFILVKNGTFDDLILDIYETWELDQLLGSNIKWSVDEFDWLRIKSSNVPFFTSMNPYGNTSSLLL